MSKRSGMTALVGLAAGIAILHGCSSEDSSSPMPGTGGSGALGGEGGDGASGTGAASSTGGADGSGGSADGGAGGAGGEGGAGETGEIICNASEQCFELPPACGSPTVWLDIIVGTENGELFTPAAPADSDKVIFALGGDDTLRAQNAHNCLVGGDGDDLLSVSYSEQSPSQILVGGEGQDVFRFASQFGMDAGDIVIADITSDEKISFEPNYTGGEPMPGSSFVQIIEGFTEATGTDATTHVIYDPTSGKLWVDYDGGGGNAPYEFALVDNHDDVELTTANFVTELTP